MYYSIRNQLVKYTGNSQCIYYALYTGGICTTHVHLVLQVAAGVSLSHSMPSHVYSSSIRSESTICTNWGLTVVRWCKENPLLPHRLYPQSVQVDPHKPRHHVQVEHAEGLSPAVVQLHFQTTPLMSSSWHKNTHTHTHTNTHTHTHMYALRRYDSVQHTGKESIGRQKYRIRT